MVAYHYIVNWSRASVCFVFFIMENAHFGWNRWPQSPEELICDGIVLTMMAMSVQKMTKPNNDN
jgi:hypothetical protein